MSKQTLGPFLLQKHTLSSLSLLRRRGWRDEGCDPRRPRCLLLGRSSDFFRNFRNVTSKRRRSAETRGKKEEVRRRWREGEERQRQMGWRGKEEAGAGGERNEGGRRFTAFFSVSQRTLWRKTLQESWVFAKRGPPASNDVEMCDLKSCVCRSDGESVSESVTRIGHTFPHSSQLRQWKQVNYGVFKKLLSSQIYVLILCGGLLSLKNLTKSLSCHSRRELWDDSQVTPEGSVISWSHQRSCGGWVFKHKDVHCFVFRVWNSRQKYDILIIWRTKLFKKEED